MATSANETTIIPSTLDAVALLQHALDAAAELVAMEIPATRFGSPTEVTGSDVRRHVGDGVLHVLAAMLHASATPAAELVRGRAQEMVEMVARRNAAIASRKIADES